MPSGTETPDLTVELARRIKAARALTGKKVRELAGELGWSQDKLYKVERGDQVPDALELAAIADATGQPVGFLLGQTSSLGVQERGTLPLPLPVVKREDADEAA